MYVASVAAIGLKPPKRISVPLIVPSVPAARIISTKPRTITSVDLPRRTKNEASTTRKPGQQPDREVDPTGEDHHQEP